MLSGERKKFGLRTARRPMLIDGLSNTAIVYDGETPHYCHILFDASLVSAVGKRLPRGVAANSPAFLHIVHDQQRSKWVVSACYVADWEPHTLWESAQRPTWIKELKSIRNNTHECTDQTHHTASAHDPHRNRRTSSVTA